MFLVTTLISVDPMPRQHTMVDDGYSYKTIPCILQI